LQAINDLISDLIRGANNVAYLSEFERASLLDRSYRLIRDCRDKIGVDQDSLDRDPAIDFLTMSRSIPMFSDKEISAAFLEAVGVLRDLRIIIDARIDAVLNKDM
jgi:hypothetical protein